MSRFSASALLRDFEKAYGKEKKREETLREKSSREESSRPTRGDSRTHTHKEKVEPRR